MAAIVTSPATYGLLFFLACMIVGTAIACTKEKTIIEEVQSDADARMSVARRWQQMVGR
jgi:hypothetical protein